MAYVLLTRPLAQSQGVMQALASPGILAPDIRIAPVIEIMPVAAHLPNFETAIFTSAHAPHRVSGMAGTAFCVGESTAQAAQQAGYTVAHVTPSAPDLLAYFADHPPNVPVHYFRGKYISLDICSALRSMGCDIAQSIVYEQRPAPLAKAVIEQLANTKGAIVPLYSKRTAEILAQQKANWCGHCAVCISAAVAKMAENMGFDRVQTADSPDGQGMIQAILRAYSQGAA